MIDSAARVWVFFYGTFMSEDVLAEHGVHPKQVRAARLVGYELCVRPRVNLFHSERSTAFGSLALTTHQELESIYTGLATQFGLVYKPEPVLAEALGGGLHPALCYLAAEMTPSAPEPVYIRELAACVRSLGHPEWYAVHVESFAE